MKTVNGNNKLERKINKLSKYQGVRVESCSNKYLKITGADENTYIMFKDGYNYRLSNSGEWYVIKPLNWVKEKPIFVKNFLAYEERNNYYHNNFLIFKSDDELLKELSLNYDDVWNLQDALKNNKDFFIDKSSPSLSVEGVVKHWSKMLS